MTIRGRTLLSVGLAIVGLMAILYLTTSTIFLEGFARVEEEDTRQNVLRVLEAISDDVTKIDFTARDWAGWDDTYNYVIGAHKSYEEDNLTESAIGVEGLQMNVVLIIGLSGTIVYGTGYDLTENRKLPLPEGMRDHLAAGSSLVTHLREQSTITGILMLPRGPLLVASRPILTNEKKGPIRGTLIFGRYLDDAALARLAQVTHLSLRVHRFDETALPADFEIARAAFDGQGSTWIRPLSQEAIAGYALLKDIYRRPALILRVDMPRSIYRQGRTTTRYSLLALVGVGLGLGGITIVLLEKLWLSRLARQASDRRFRELFENAHDIVFTLDLTGRFTSINPSAERISGYSRDEALTMNIAQVVAPEHRELVQRLLAKGIMQSGRTPLELDILAKEGRRVSLEVSAQRITREGRPEEIQGIARDITERRQAEAALRTSEERYMLAVQGANDGLWDWDLLVGRIYLSPRWKSMLGYQETEIGSDPQEWFSRVHRDDLERLRTQIDAHLDGVTPHLECEYRLWHRDGSCRWMLCRGLGVRDGTVRAHRIAGSQTDITDRKVAEQQLLHDAMHDGLTGLPNRALFIDRLEQVMRRARRRADDRFAVLFLDIDGFKVVNDSLGHLAGDQLLREIGRRLEANLRVGDTVARLGGDEFAVLLDDIEEVSDASPVADRIRETLAAPFNLNGHEVFVTASMGIAPSAGDYLRAEEYLRDADTAMYRAKEQGKARYVVFSPEMHTRVLTLLRLQSELRRAVEHDEFRLHYQPIVALHDGRVVALEALVRWLHPQRGLVPPGEFIPEAEETGLIVPIGTWVLKEASRQMREWSVGSQRSAGRVVSVNLSRRQLAQADLADQIERVLKGTGANPQAMQLEITESVLMENVDAASAILSRLRSLGVGLTVDDFGTGYSSLSALQRFPISTLKIDRSFVKGMVRGGETAEIVRAIIMMSQSLGMSVVAEGVETPVQLALLRELGCEFVQGFFFSKPVEPSAAVQFLDARFNWKHMPSPASKRAG